MKRHSNRNIVMAVVTVFAVILVAGGAAIASNAGFKFNMPLVLQTSGGQQGHNWVSIPYFVPYSDAGDFCLQTGLATTGISRPTIATIDTAGAVEQVTCGTSAADNKLLTPGEGFRIINPAASVPAPANLIVVGSHNPSLALTIPDASSGGSASNNFWLSIPYHSTATNREDLCTQIGLTGAGITRATVLGIDPASGGAGQTTCGTAASTAAALVLGQSLRLREPVGGPIIFTPAHF